MPRKGYGGTWVPLYGRKGYGGTWVPLYGRKGYGGTWVPLYIYVLSAALRSSNRLKLSNDSRCA